MQIVGTDSCFGLLLGLVSTTLHIGEGNYDLLLLMRLSVGGAIGVAVGTLVAMRIDKASLKKLVLFLVFVSGMQMVIRGCNRQ
jgi:uncharacterized membrane protein YfcA